jgi:hypothetical protein
MHLSHLFDKQSYVLKFVRSLQPGISIMFRSLLWFKLQSLEAWHINMSNHALNRDDSAYLPEEYMYLIGR